VLLPRRVEAVVGAHRITAGWLVSGAVFVLALVDPQNAAFTNENVGGVGPLHYIVLAAVRSDDLRRAGLADLHAARGASASGASSWSVMPVWREAARACVGIGAWGMRGGHGRRPDRGHESPA